MMRSNYTVTTVVFVVGFVLLQRGSESRSWGDGPPSSPTGIGADSQALPAQASFRLGTQDLRETSKIYTGALSYDGKLVATGRTADGSVSVWDLRSGKLLKLLTTARRSQTTVIAFSPNGKHIVAYGILAQNQGLDLWDYETGKHRFLKSELHFGDMPAYGKALVFSPNNKLLAVIAPSSGDILIWDIASEKMVHQLKGHKNQVQSVAFSPDGKHLASGGGWVDGDDTDIRIWETTTGKEVDRLREPAGQLLAVAYAPDGKTLATGDSEGKVVLWDLKDKKIIQRWKLPYRTTSLTFTQDGKVLAAGAVGNLWLWNPENGKEIRVLKGCSGSPVAFTPDGKILVRSGANAIHKIDSATGKEIDPLPGHPATVAAVRFSPTGDLLASVDTTYRVFLWNLRSGTLRQNLDLSNGQPSGEGSPWFCGHAPAFAPAGDVLACFSRDQKQAVQLWDVTKAQQIAHFADNSPYCVSLSFQSDGSTLAFCGTGGKGLRLFSLATQKELPLPLDLPLNSDGGPALSGKLAFTGQGSLFLSLRHDHIQFYDRDTFSPLSRFEIKNDKQEGKPKNRALFRPFRDYRQSPDGRLLGLIETSRHADESNALFVCDLATGKLLCTIEPAPRGQADENQHEGAIVDVALSPDGRLLASAGLIDKTVRLWDARSGKHLHCFKGHDGGVTSVDFSPDGKTLASGSTDTTILLWDVAPFYPPAPKWSIR